MNNIEMETAGYKSFFEMGKIVCIEAFREIFNEEYKELCKWKNHNDLICNKDFISFEEGWLKAYHEDIKKRFIDDKVEEFLEELRILCKKYNVKMLCGDEDSYCTVNTSNTYIDI